MTKPRKGWVQIHGGLERYRYLLDNHRMLMVVGTSQRKWYYGEMPYAKHPNWKPAGRATSMRLAMKQALAMVGRFEEQEEELSDGAEAEREAVPRPWFRG